MTPAAAGKGTLVALLVLITALLLIPLPYISEARNAPALANGLENLGHPLAFGLVAWIAYGQVHGRLARVGVRGPIFLILLLAAFGALTEMIQAHTGRDPTIGDWIGDVLGSSAAVFWRWSGRRWMRSASLLCMAAAAAPLAFVLLSYGARWSEWPVVWRQGSPWLRAFSESRLGAYPGLAVKEPRPDWTAFRTLAVDVRNLRDEPTAISVRVHDRQHNGSFGDRFNRVFDLPPAAASTLRIDLEDVRQGPTGRDMDLRHITGVIIFTRAMESMPFTVDSVRLEH